MAALIVFPLFALVVGLFLGFTIGVGVDTKRRLAELGFTKNSAKLYRRAINLLNRMSRVIELDGHFAGDVLSPETKRQVDDLLTDYRKEINQP